jgi:TetR/AcrR family fatty acid metabolism transcriptional regulator
MTTAEKAAQRAAKRERILRGAIKVFAQKGFHSCRVSEIARAAGVADGTIYLYFKSKDDILISLFEDRMDALCRAIERETSAVDGPSDRLQRIVDVQLGTVKEHRDLAEVVSINLRQSNRFLKQFAAPRFNRYLDLIAAVVADGQKRGAFRADVSPRVFACALFGALDGLILTWVLGRGGPERLARAGASAATILIEGIRKPGASGTTPCEARTGRVPRAKPATSEPAPGGRPSSPRDRLPQRAAGRPRGKGGNP